MSNTILFLVIISIFVVILLSWGWSNNDESGKYHVLRVQNNKYYLIDTNPYPKKLCVNTANYLTTSTNIPHIVLSANSLYQYDYIVE